jgi:pimeloyl-ACP methyl ester carboxylesterase
MRMIAFALVALLAAPVAGQPAGDMPAALWSDPAVDEAHPAALVETRIESDGAAMNAIAYVPSGAGPHPAMLLLHGFPGNEMNLDLAQAARRQGWLVLTMHYRGSWGSEGDFSFSNVLEDSAAAYDWLVAPAQQAKFNIDPARIIVAGHSMGGFAATVTAASRPAAGLLLMDAWNPGLGAKALPEGVDEAPLAAFFARNIAPLSGTSGEALASEYLANKDRFDLTGYAASIAPRPVISFAATRGLAAENKALTAAFVDASPATITAPEWATDHSFSDARIRLIAASLDWLRQFEAR